MTGETTGGQLPAEQPEEHENAGPIGDAELDRQLASLNQVLDAAVAAADDGAAQQAFVEKLRERQQRQEGEV